MASRLGGKHTRSILAFPTKLDEIKNVTVQSGVNPR